MLRALAGGEKTTAELARLAGIEVVSLQGHLAKLKRAGLITPGRYGVEAYCKLANVTQTAAALEFTHPCGAKVVVALEKPPPPSAFITFRDKKR